MKPLIHARKELRSAQPTSLDGVEEGWVAYLRHLERSWNKAQAQLKVSSKFQGWPHRGHVDALRTKDPLLSYLINARGCEEHGIEPIAKKTPGGIGINAAEGNRLYIKKMEMVNGILRIDSAQRIKVTIDPGKFRLVPIVNRGVTYAVPTSHLNSNILAEDPASIAELGLIFYAEFIDKAEAEFVK